MKDIDFDELDRAVSSLMGGAKKNSSKDEAKILNISPTLKENELPQYNNIRQAAEKIGSETLDGATEHVEQLHGITDDEVASFTFNSQPPEANKETMPEPSKPADPVVTTPTVTADVSSVATIKTQSGRFMDVMHPSSDMTTATNNSRQTINSSRNLREAAVIERPQPAPVPISETEAEVPVPEPIAVVDPVVEATVESVVSEEIIPIDTPSPAAIIPVEKISGPQTSPFLPSAKVNVEKRPLGGGAVVTENSVDATTINSALDISSYDQPYRSNNSADTQLAPSANLSDLPEELGTNLMAIETNLAESQDIVQKPFTADQSAAVTQSVQIGSESVSDNPSDGAIFDTNEYHTSVTHPAKHTSEWVWIIVIVLIIVICAAGAAAFYLLGAK